MTESLLVAEADRIDRDDPVDLERLDRLLARGIRVIRLIHPDLFGRQRGKQFPVSELPGILGGVAYSKVSLAEDLFGVPVDEAEFTQLAGHPDLHARIEPATAIIPPWEPDAVWVLSSLWEGDARSPLCARGQLVRALEELQRAHGCSAVAAGEPEFYLFERDAEGRPTQRPYSAEGVSYTIDRVTDPAGVVGRIHRGLVDLGIGVTAVNREFSPGQFEVNLRHAPALAAADRAFLLKTAIKELAVVEGRAANFMAKPLGGEEGSSLHIHVSLWRDDANAFAGSSEGEPSSGAPLADVLRHAIGGLQAHAPALTALSSPTANSFKRLQGEGLSPDAADWGEDDRHVYLRIPAERGPATRIELRAGDASASPHLLLAGMIHAIRDGLDRRIEPLDAGAPLPRSLEDAIAALRADAVLASGFGREFVDVYAALKLSEARAARLAVTDWEWRTYHSHA
ncbi:glutamine synthetase family protein [Leucobacter iarius]|uniref:Type I glutamate--ammonia ligase n=1 Tax=Leucobacter iarius TaxID=333963 RepID=A0ABN2L962_9MICO